MLVARVLCAIVRVTMEKTPPQRPQDGRDNLADRVALNTARRAFVHALGLDMDSMEPRLRAVIEALSEEVLCLRDDLDGARSALRQAVLQADRDALVDLFNRRAFMRELRREIALADRFGTPLTLIFMDLDGFKTVNDRFGHAAGDQTLRRVAGVLRDKTRDTDILARLGGDEFAIALARADIEQGRAKAAELTRHIDQIRVGEEASGTPAFALGASCGVASWRRGWSADALISEADSAMFAQKAARKASQG